MTRSIETSQPGTSNASEPKHQAVSAEDVARAIAPGVWALLDHHGVNHSLSVQQKCEETLEQAERVLALLPSPAPTEAHDAGVVGDLTPEESARVAWIEAELADEPNRTPWGRNGTEPCRNGHEIAHLQVELLELKLKSSEARLAALAKYATQQATIELSGSPGGLKGGAEPVAWDWYRYDADALGPQRLYSLAQPGSDGPTEAMLDAGVDAMVWALATDPLIPQRLTCAVKTADGCVVWVDKNRAERFKNAKAGA